jgi:hypothetical protein
LDKLIISIQFSYFIYLHSNRKWNDRFDQMIAP